MDEKQQDTRKVVKGSVEKRAKTKISEILFAGDPVTAFKVALMEVAIPKIAEMFVSAVDTMAKVLVYGNGYTPTPSSPRTGYTGYDKAYDNRKLVKPVEDRFNLTQWGFAYREDAQRVLDQMREHLMRYSSVTVFDFYDFAGLDTRTTDRGYGWTSLEKAYVDRMGDQYVIKFPRPSEIG